LLRMLQASYVGVENSNHVKKETRCFIPNYSMTTSRIPGQSKLVSPKWLVSKLRMVRFYKIESNQSNFKIV